MHTVLASGRLCINYKAYSFCCWKIRTEVFRLLSRRSSRGIPILHEKMWGHYNLIATRFQLLCRHTTGGIFESRSELKH
jgi:hypothetical protein